MDKKESSARKAFQKNLNYYMELRGIEQSDIVNRLNITASTVSDWVNGKKYPRVDAMQRLADMLGVRMAQLTDDGEVPPASERFAQWDNLRPIKKQRIPLLGEIAAGQPIYAEQEYETYVDADENLHADFALKVKGNSMHPKIQDGDVIFIRSQPDVCDGQIAAVVVDDTATLKCVYHLQNGVQLVSINPDYPPMLFTQENSDVILILGLAIGIYRGL